MYPIEADREADFEEDLKAMRSLNKTKYKVAFGNHGLVLDCADGSFW
jgi:hypothetical protein